VNEHDLNSIKTLSCVLKQHIDDMADIRTSLDNLWKAAQEAWKSVMTEDIRKHILTMPDRVAEVL